MPVDVRVGGGHRSRAGTHANTGTSSSHAKPVQKSLRMEDIGLPEEVVIARKEAREREEAIKLEIDDCLGNLSNILGTYEVDAVELEEELTNRMRTRSPPPLDYLENPEDAMFTSGIGSDDVSMTRWELQQYLLDSEKSANQGDNEEESKKVVDKWASSAPDKRERLEAIIHHLALRGKKAEMKNQELQGIIAELQRSLVDVTATNLKDRNRMEMFETRAFELAEKLKAKDTDLKVTRDKHHRQERSFKDTIDGLSDKVQLTAIEKEDKIQKLSLENTRLKALNMRQQSEYEEKLRIASFDSVSRSLLDAASEAEQRQRKQVQSLEAENSSLKGQLVKERAERTTEMAKHAKWETTYQKRLSTANLTISELHASLSVLKQAYERAGLVWGLDESFRKMPNVVMASLAEIKKKEPELDPSDEPSVNPSAVEQALRNELVEVEKKLMQTEVELSLQIDMERTANADLRKELLSVKTMFKIQEKKLKKLKAQSKLSPRAKISFAITQTDEVNWSDFDSLSGTTSSITTPASNKKEKNLGEDSGPRLSPIQHSIECTTQESQTDIVGEVLKPVEPPEVFSQGCQVGDSFKSMEPDKKLLQAVEDIKETVKGYGFSVSAHEAYVKAGISSSDAANTFVHSTISHMQTVAESASTWTVSCEAMLRAAVIESKRIKMESDGAKRLLQARLRLALDANDRLRAEINFLKASNASENETIASDHQNIEISKGIAVNMFEFILSAAFANIASAESGVSARESFEETRNKSSMMSEKGPLSYQVSKGMQAGGPIYTEPSNAQDQSHSQEKLYIPEELMNSQESKETTNSERPESSNALESVETEQMIVAEGQSDEQPLAIVPTVGTVPRQMAKARASLHLYTAETLSRAFSGWCAVKNSGGEVVSVAQASSTLIDLSKGKSGLGNTIGEAISAIQENAQNWNTTYLHISNLAHEIEPDLHALRRIEEDPASMLLTTGIKNLGETFKEQIAKVKQERNSKIETLQHESRRRLAMQFLDQKQERKEREDLLERVKAAEEAKQDVLQRLLMASQEASLLRSQLKESSQIIHDFESRQNRWQQHMKKTAQTWQEKLADAMFRAREGRTNLLAELSEARQEKDELEIKLEGLSSGFPSPSNSTASSAQLSPLSQSAAAYDIAAEQILESTTRLLTPDGPGTSEREEIENTQRRKAALNTMSAHTSALQSSAEVRTALQSAGSAGTGASSTVKESEPVADVDEKSKKKENVQSLDVSQLLDAAPIASISPKEERPLIATEVCSIETQTEPATNLEEIGEGRLSASPCPNNGDAALNDSKPPSNASGAPSASMMRENVQLRAELSGLKQQSAFLQRQVDNLESQLEKFHSKQLDAEEMSEQEAGNFPVCSPHNGKTETKTETLPLSSEYHSESSKKSKKSKRNNRQQIRKNQRNFAIQTIDLEDDAISLQKKLEVTEHAYHQLKTKLSERQHALQRLLDEASRSSTPLPILPPSPNANDKLKRQKRPSNLDLHVPEWSSQTNVTEYVEYNDESATAKQTSSPAFSFEHFDDLVSNVHSAILERHKLQEKIRDMKQEMIRRAINITRARARVETLRKELRTLSVDNTASRQDLESRLALAEQTVATLKTEIEVLQRSSTLANDKVKELHKREIEHADMRIRNMSQALKASEDSANIAVAMVHYCLHNGRQPATAAVGNASDALRVLLMQNKEYSGKKRRGGQILQDVLAALGISGDDGTSVTSDALSDIQFFNNDVDASELQDDQAAQHVKTSRSRDVHNNPPKVSCFSFPNGNSQSKRLMKMVDEDFGDLDVLVPALATVRNVNKISSTTGDKPADKAQEAKHRKPSSQYKLDGVVVSLPKPPRGAVAHSSEVHPRNKPAQHDEIIHGVQSEKQKQEHPTIQSSESFGQPKNPIGLSPRIKRQYDRLSEQNQRLTSPSSSLAHQEQSTVQQKQASRAISIAVKIPGLDIDKTIPKKGWGLNSVQTSQSARPWAGDEGMPTRPSPVPTPPSVLLTSADNIPEYVSKEDSATAR